MAKKRQRQFLDTSVFFVFIVFIIIGLGSFGYKMYNHQECPNIVVELPASRFYAGELVQFINKTSGEESNKWDFGDESPVSNKKNPSHIYETPGKYTVKLEVDNQCFEFLEVVVDEKIVPVDDKIFPKFSGPSSTMVGRKISFRNLTVNGKTFEWRFGETGKVDSRSKDASYVFKTPGNKTVSLMVNGDPKYIISKRIYVEPKPKREVPKLTETKPEPKTSVEEITPDDPEDWGGFNPVVVTKTPVKKEVKKYTDRDLIIMIENYSNSIGGKNEILKTFCDGITNPVVEANGTNMRFDDFLKDIKGKKIKIKSFQAYRKSAEGCITKFNIRYRK